MKSTKPVFTIDEMLFDCMVVHTAEFRNDKANPPRREERILYLHPDGRETEAWIIAEEGPCK